MLLRNALPNFFLASGFAAQIQAFSALRISHARTPPSARPARAPLLLHVRTHANSADFELLNRIAETFSVRELLATNSQPTTFATPRRSRRIWFTMPIRISLFVDERLQWEEETSTLVVNAHGALVLLNHEVSTGQVLTIGDLSSAEKRKCRVVMLGARTSGMTEVGIELLEPFANFWRVRIPPPDWAAFASPGNVPVAVAAGKPKL